VSTRFDALDDEIRWPCVAANDTSGFGNTFAVIFKSGTTTTNDRAIFAYHNSAGSPTLDFLVWGASAYDAGNAGTTVGTNTSPISGWTIGVVTKASGTSGARFHTCPLTSGTWTHQANDIGTSYSQTASSTGGTIRVGEENDTMDFDGWIAVVAAWRGAMSDIQVEALSANLKTSDWLNHAFGAPVFLSELNANVGGVYTDLSTNGQNSTVVNGTTIDSVNDPPGWTYDGTGTGGGGGGADTGSGTFDTGTFDSGTFDDLAPAAPPTGTNFHDWFDRTVSGGWGTPTNGPAYTYQPAGTDFSVNGSRGVILPTAANANRFAVMPVALLDQDFTVTAQPSILPSASMQPMLHVRRVDANNYVRLNLRLASTGVITWSLETVIAGAIVEQTGGAVSSGVTIAAGTDFKMRVQALGTNPTNINAKIWLASASEPATWGLTFTTSQTVLQVASDIAIGLFSGSPTTHPTWTFENLYDQAAASGQALTLDLSDTLTLADVLGGAVTRPLAETLTVTDVLGAAPATALAETLTVADTLSGAPAKTLAETLTVTDALSRSPAATLAETLTVSDVLSGAPAPVLAETLSVSDSVTTAPAKVLSEPLTVTDATSAQATTSIADTLTVTEQLSAAATTALAETLVIGDQLAPAIVLAVTIDDTLTVDDQLAPLSILTVTIGDTLTMADQVTASAGHGETETLQITDAISSTLTARLTLAETLAIIDVLTSSIGHGETDTLTLVDSLAGSASVTISDPLALTDLLAAGAVTALAETLSIADTLTPTAAGVLAVNLSDTLTIADQLAASTGKQLADLATLADTIAATVAHIETDPLTVTDTLTAAAIKTLQLADTLTVADALIVDRYLGARIDDALTVNDALTAAVATLLRDFLTVDDQLIPLFTPEVRPYVPQVRLRARRTALFLTRAPTLAAFVRPRLLLVTATRPATSVTVHDVGRRTSTFRTAGARVAGFTTTGRRTAAFSQPGRALTHTGWRGR
jgi:hypothetical protein